MIQHFLSWLSVRRSREQIPASMISLARWGYIMQTELLASVAGMPILANSCNQRSRVSSPLQPIAAQHLLGHHQHLLHHSRRHHQVHRDPSPTHSHKQVMPH